MKIYEELKIIDKLLLEILSRTQSTYKNYCFFLVAIAIVNFSLLLLVHYSYRSFATSTVIYHDLLCFIFVIDSLLPFLIPFSIDIAMSLGAEKSNNYYIVV